MHFNIRSNNNNHLAKCNIYIEQVEELLALIFDRLVIDAAQFNRRLGRLM
jgi:hypothetical protein